MAVNATCSHHPSYQSYLSRITVYSGQCTQGEGQYPPYHDSKHLLLYPVASLCWHPLQPLQLLPPLLPKRCSHWCKITEQCVETTQRNATTTQPTGARIAKQSGTAVANINVHIGKQGTERPAKLYSTIDGWLKKCIV